MPKPTCVPHVVEYNGPDEVTWVVSFTDHNPRDEDCVEMKDGETAFKLCDLIASRAQCCVSAQRGR